MKGRGTVILLLAAVLLAGFYFLHAAPASKENALREELSKRFLRMEPAEIDFIKIRNGHGSFELVKEGDGWKLTAPAKVAVDDRTLGRILELVRKGKVLKVVATDAGKGRDYGLDHPAAVLYVGYRGNVGQLSLGGASPAQNGVYAYASGINAIFLVDKEIASSLDVDLFALRTKSLFVFDPGAVTRVTMSRPETTVELVREKEGWRMVRPVAGRADDDAVRDLLLGIRNQRADEIFDDHLEESGGGRETVTIDLVSAGVARTTLHVSFLGTGAREGTFGHQEGLPYAGRLPREFRDLLSREPSRLRYRRLFALNENEEPAAIVVQRESAGYELKRKGSGWFLGDRAVDPGRVRQLVWFLKGWKADRMLGAAPHGERRESSEELTVTDATGRAQKLAVYGKMQGPATESTPYYAFSGELNEFCALNALDLKKIPTKEELLQ